MLWTTGEAAAKLRPRDVNQVRLLGDEPRNYRAASGIGLLVQARDIRPSTCNASGLG
jgi:hypothetical protein